MSGNPASLYIAGGDRIMTKAGAVLAGRIAGEQKELLVLVNRVEEDGKGQRLSTMTIIWTVLP